MDGFSQERYNRVRIGRGASWKDSRI